MQMLLAIKYSTPESHQQDRTEQMLEKNRANVNRYQVFNSSKPPQDGREQMLEKNRANVNRYQVFNSSKPPTRRKRTDAGEKLCKC